MSIVLDDNSFKTNNTGPLEMTAPPMTFHLTDSDADLGFDEDAVVNPIDEPYTPGPDNQSGNALPPPPKKNGKAFPVLLLVLAVVAFMYFKNK